MKLPYAGEKGCSIIKYLKKDLRKTLPANVEADIISTITKLSSQSNSVKDPTPLEEQHDLIYHSVCNHDYCNDDWFGKQDQVIFYSYTTGYCMDIRENCYNPSGIQIK